MEIALRTSAGGIEIASEGAPAAITFAPQGGFILLAGVRARGMDTCIELTAALKDEEQNDRVVSVELRPAQLEDGGDGWLYPRSPTELYNWANLPTCPNAALARDLVGETYRLEISATDGETTSAASRHVVPTCAYGDAYCIESCSLNTALGPSR